MNLLKKCSKVLGTSLKILDYDEYHEEKDERFWLPMPPGGKTWLYTRCWENRVSLVIVKVI